MPLTNHCSHSRLSKSLYIILPQEAEDHPKFCPMGRLSLTVIFQDSWSPFSVRMYTLNQFICKASTVFFLFSPAGSKGPHPAGVSWGEVMVQQCWYGGLDHLLVQLTGYVWPCLCLTPDVLFPSRDRLLWAVQPYDLQHMPGSTHEGQFWPHSHWSSDTQSLRPSGMPRTVSWVVYNSPMQMAWPCSRILRGLHCSSPIRPCPIAPGKEFRPTTKLEEVVSHKTLLTFDTNCMSGGGF